MLASEAPSKEAALTERPTSHDKAGIAELFRTDRATARAAIEAAGSGRVAFSKGTKVELCGLSRAELNGQFGVVSSELSESGRVGVLVTSVEKVLAIKPVNLKMAPVKKTEFPVGTMVWSAVPLENPDGSPFFDGAGNPALVRTGAAGRDELFIQIATVTAAPDGAAGDVFELTFPGAEARGGVRMRRHHLAPISPALFAVMADMAAGQ